MALNFFSVKQKVYSAVFLLILNVFGTGCLFFLLFQGWVEGVFLKKLICLTLASYERWKSGYGIFLVSHQILQNFFIYMLLFGRGEEESLIP